MDYYYNLGLKRFWWSHIFVISLNCQFKPNNFMKTASWVIIEKETGIAVLETYNESLINNVNTKKYKVIPILEYLQSINIKLKENENR